MTMNSVKNNCELYLKEVETALRSIQTNDVEKAIDMLLEVYSLGKTIFVVGNGGSASASGHIACDLSKGTIENRNSFAEKRVKCISLTDNIASITAIGNDISYDDIFVEQLKNLASNGDVILAISASGNSKNVVKAVAYGKKIGMKSIGILGFKNGGKLADLVSIAILIDSSQYGPIEDVQLAVGHMIASVLANEKNNKNKTINKAIPFSFT